MTSDAKIGVLLGLVFIFFIAFLINGFPNFEKDRNNSELTTDMVSVHDNRLGLASRERQVSREFYHRIKPVRQEPVEIRSLSQADDGVRFSISLPDNVTEADSSAGNEEEAVNRESIIGAELRASAVKKKEKQSQEPVRVIPIKPASARIYVVQSGDSLASIAKDVYGDEDGNKLASVERIFKSNRDRVKSPGEIFEGQRLLIPPLRISVGYPGSPSRVLSSSIVKKVESVGERRLSVRAKQESAEQWYVVKEGDSLWKIAEEQLGDGNRYGEIVNLNADEISNEDSLSIGMRLKLPGR